MGALAVIGGSGMYDIEGLTRISEERVETPYGPPSDLVVRSKVEGTDCEMLFLPRHGRGHRLSPSTINYRANICALKKLGASAILSVTAVGSMKESIAPGDLVVVDQFIDLTKRRISTFFDDGMVGHVPFADPVCPILREAVLAAARQTDVKTHDGGTYVCIEGPQFSTRAESMLYRSWGVSVIGMTNMPEAKLAREAQIPYATLALSTDYDCWHASEEAVNVEAVVRQVQKNVRYAKAVAKTLAQTLPDLSDSPAQTALHNAVMTAKDAISADAQARLSWLLPPS